MHLSTQPYKGTRDFYPEEMRVRSWMFHKMAQVVQLYGYQEYNGPMLEPFELYAAKTGEEIVNQQLYWLMDKAERKLAVRPEMTPTLARMVAGKVHELPKPIRWYSIPNLWRYEKPQRGRLREHWQLNVDVLGGDPLLADAEILALAINIIKAFGGEKFIKIHVNHRKLVDHFFKSNLGLSSEVALKVSKAIDARAKVGEKVYQSWLVELGIQQKQQEMMEWFFNSPFEEIHQKVPCAGLEDLRCLFEFLKESGLGEFVQYDATVLRGLDYYTGTVFEMYDVSPENRRAMFGGGRYDNLVGLFGNTKLPGVGFGMGDVTFRNFLETHHLLPEFSPQIDVFLTLPKVELRPIAERIAQLLRDANIKVMTPLNIEGFGSQLKSASKHQACFAILLGEEELKENKVILKNLKTTQQEVVSITALVSELSLKLQPQT